MTVPKAKRKTDPCPCGSGTQYRYCHGAAAQDAADPSPEISRKPRQLFLVVLLVGAPIAYVAGMYQSRQPQTTRVWSEEHGHYHTAAQLAAEAKAAEGGSEAAAATPGKAPAGPIPPGKEWSEAHGHWHDVGGANAGEPVHLDPSSGGAWDHEYKIDKPKEDRPNATWSEAHGHWHDN